MRNRALHETLHAFTADAALQLTAETARGEEIPFEVVEARRGRVPLYCYRPLTDRFIDDRLALLEGLPTYAPALRALAGVDGLDEYLRERGVSPIPSAERERADAGLRHFLAAVFADRSDFELDAARFDAAYAELERAAYEGRCVTTVIAPLLGLALDPESDEVPLGDGLCLRRGESMSDAPPEAVWGDNEDPKALLVLTVTEERSARPPVSIARTRFRRILTALRLFEPGGYALGPVAWTRTDTGAWRPVTLGGSGRPRLVTVLEAEHEDELRAFCNLVGRRLSIGGEVAWALSRFEMGRERLAPFEALTDYLLALRALLEPEGPGSGRLAGRLAALCAGPDDRPALAERVAHAISLERAVISGLAPAQTGVDGLVEELAEHLRALLRDVLCGHLDPEVRATADAILAEGAEDPATDEHFVAAEEPEDMDLDDETIEAETLPTR